MGLFSKAKTPEESAQEQTLYCSFCGRSQHDVVKLIAGPKVYICNECVALCHEIIVDDVRSDLPSEVLSVEELRQRLDENTTGQNQAKNTLLALGRYHLQSIHHKTDLPTPTLLLVGPSGSSKTALTQAICTSLSLPWQHVDCAVLKDADHGNSGLEEVLSELYKQSTEKTFLASRGVVVFDGLDRITKGVSSAPNTVSGNVQRDLLRALEGQTVVFRTEPNAPTQSFSCHQLYRVVTYQLDNVPATDQEIRAALEKEGVLPELLSRIACIVSLQARKQEELYHLLDTHLLPPRADLVAALGGELKLDNDAKQLLAQRALQAGDNAWSLHRDLASLTTHIFAHPFPARIWNFDRATLEQLLQPT